MKYLIVCVGEDAYGGMEDQYFIRDTFEEVEWDVRQYWDTHIAWGDAARCDVYEVTPEPIDTSVIRDIAHAEALKVKLQNQLAHQKREEERERQEFDRLKEKYGGVAQ